LEKNNKKVETGYWRGFKELYKDPEFEKAKENEFAEEIVESSGLTGLSGISRRKFLALFTASAAFAAAGCSDYRDKGAIVPYNKKPEEITPGVPNWYASTCTLCPNACGILIKTREGRPIKVDGNPDHPVSKGKICAKGQAGILNFYDPERLKEPMIVSGSSNITSASWEAIDEKIISELKNLSTGGKEVAIITHSVLSPTQKKLFDDFIAVYPTTKIYSYELTNDINFRNAFKKSYGTDFIPTVKLDEAKIILSLESDFLGNEGNTIENARLYSQGRDVFSKKEFNRLYAVEGAMSLTGVNADYRIRLRTDATEEFVLCLLNELIIKKKISSYANNNTIENNIKEYSLDEFIKKYKLPEETVKTLVEDLVKNTGESYVSAGLKLPESTHIVVNLLNEVIGASKLFSKESYKQSILPLSAKADIDGLISRMQSGSIGMVVHFDTNPAFHFSADYNYSDALKKVATVITMSESINESSLVSNYILAINHNFESWGDFKMRSGFYSLQQPVIAPLYTTRQKEAVLLNWIKGGKETFTENLYLDYIKTNWEKNIYPSINSKVDFKTFWNLALHDGVVNFEEKVKDNSNFKTEVFTSISGFSKASKDLAVILRDSYYLGDGRLANNGWLQELPHPVSKIVWDNYAAISPATAGGLNLDSNDLVELSAGGKSIKLPVFIQPGMADDVITIELGYGRNKIGIVGQSAGFDAIKLISKNAPLSEWIYNDGKITKAGGTYELVSTQEHYPIDEKRYNDIHLKREIIQEGTYEEYKKNPKFLTEEKKHTTLFNINEGHEYNGVKWAMSIDLNKCIGCNNCVAACNVENNIPVVGKEQVGKNREMQWIRLDRYYGGHSDNPKVSFQPMLCQHCDNAPCENVCPVAATNHSPDGLNQMAYNRCVGTRYCSNNCPFKVRRYNYFNFRDHFADAYQLQQPLSLLYNPEVTVRSRGVMEKCTFCIQRIMDERQKAIQEKRDIDGDKVVTACQEACPTNAIVFGDLHKKDSEITKHREHELGYHVLEEINVRPNVTYIAKLRNIKAEKAK
jgi:MoCo/4Fe-4S cofactor protein with predicted Tat translocation signal